MLGSGGNSGKIMPISPTRIYYLVDVICRRLVNNNNRILIISYGRMRYAEYLVRKNNWRLTQKTKQGEGKDHRLYDNVTRSIRKTWHGQKLRKTRSAEVDLRLQQQNHLSERFNKKSLTRGRNDVE